MNIPSTQYLQNHTQEVCGVKWSPTDEFLLSGGNDKKVHVWSVKSDYPIMKGSHEGGIRALAWSH